MTSQKDEEEDEERKLSSEDKTGGVSPRIKEETVTRFNSRLPRGRSLENTLSDFIENRRTSSIAVLRQKAKEHEECLMSSKNTML